MPNLIKMRVHSRDCLTNEVYFVDDANALPYVSEETKRFLNSEAFLRSVDPYLCIGDCDLIFVFTLTEK